LNKLPKKTDLMPALESAYYPDKMNTTNHNPTFSAIYNLLTHVGYTLESTILEFTDNSVSHESSNVHVCIIQDRDDGAVSRIIVMDDGIGMTMQQLTNSWTIGNEEKWSNRDQSDIGKFHTGMKSAAFNLGKDITIVTKHANITPSGDTIIEASALRADIDSMREMDSFAPSEKSPYTDDFARKWIPKNIAEKFAANRTGTLIQIRYMNAMATMVKQKAVERISKALSTAYMLETNCDVFLDDEIVPSHDAFYRNGQGVWKQHDTLLSLYGPETPGGPYRVFETNTARRYGQGSAAHDWGYADHPTYFEYKALGPGEAYYKNMTRVEKLPDADRRIGPVIPVRMVQVADATYDTERKAGILPDKRSGMTIRRGQRVVGSGMSLGRNLGQRSTMATEYQRMEVVVSQEHDYILGLQFNKKMSDQSLPSVELTDALYSVYKQLSSPWAREWDDNRKAAADPSVRSDQSDEDEIIAAPPANPFRALYPQYQNVRVPEPAVNIPAAPLETDVVPDEVVVPEPVAVVVPEPVVVVVSRENTFLARFGFTIERCTEAMAWLAENPDV
jgi:hypothetical protein